MKMDAFAFCTTNWAEIERTEHRGETGNARTEADINHARIDTACHSHHVHRHIPTMGSRCSIFPR